MTYSGNTSYDDSSDQQSEVVVEQSVEETSAEEVSNVIGRSGNHWVSDITLTYQQSPGGDEWQFGNPRVKGSGGSVGTRPNDFRNKGAVEFYDCILEYGDIDYEELLDGIEFNEPIGIKRREDSRDNVDRDGVPRPQFGHECVNYPVEGGWDYVDYTYYEKFEGFLGPNVTPLHTIPFGPPNLIGNLNYTGNRIGGLMFKGASWLKNGDDRDINLVLPFGDGVKSGIKKKDSWQSGWMEGGNSDHSVMNATAVGGAGGANSAGGELGDFYDKLQHAGFTNSSSNHVDHICLGMGGRNLEAQVTSTNKSSKGEQINRAFLMVDHHHGYDINSFRSPSMDYGVVGVSGWVYPTQSGLKGEMPYDFQKNTSPRGMDYSSLAINFVYAAYVKDSSDEELERREEEIKVFLEELEHLLEIIQEEINATDEDNRISSEAFGLPLEDEDKKTYDFLTRLSDTGTLDRLDNFVLKNNTSIHSVVQLMCEIISSKLPRNEGKAPHEWEFPITHDRVCEEIAADGRVTFLDLLSYIYFRMHGVSDRIMKSLGHIPSVKTLSDFKLGDDLSDKAKSKFYVLLFILWASSPRRQKDLDRLGQNERGEFTVYWEDGTYLSFPEFVHYDTEGFCNYCERIGGEVAPVAFMTKQGVHGFNELHCIDQQKYIENEIYEVLDTCHLAGTRMNPDDFKLLDNEDSMTDFDEEHAEEQTEYRNKIIENVKLLGPQARSGLGGTADPNESKRYATKEEARIYSRWDRRYDDPNAALKVFWQEGPNAPPAWDYFDYDAVLGGTYEFHPYVYNGTGREKEMITFYQWVNYPDLEDEFGELKQKPNFEFWFSDQREGTNTWRREGAPIRVEAIQIVEDENGEKIPLIRPGRKTYYKISVPAGAAPNSRRFFRIGAYYHKGTAMQNDPAVMGRREDWKRGKHFVLEVIPAVKDEPPTLNDPKKGPVYHATRANNQEPDWKNDHWVRPLNFVKVNNKKLTVGKWYKVEWDRTSSFYASKDTVPNLRPFWGAEGSDHPEEINASDIPDYYSYHSAQLTATNEQGIYVKAKTPYLYFGATESGRTMEQWSKDGEPWVKVSLAKNVTEGPLYLAPYENTPGMTEGVIDIEEERWNEPISFLDVKRDKPDLGNITGFYIPYAGYESGGKLTTIDFKYFEQLEATRIGWYMDTTVPAASRHHHNFNFANNIIGSFPKNNDKTNNTKYQSRTQSKPYSTWSPRSVEIRKNSSDLYIFDMESRFINWGTYAPPNAVIDGQTVARKISNWSPLGEKMQLKGGHVVNVSGPFYWALSHKDIYNTAAEDRAYDVWGDTTTPGTLPMTHRHWPTDQAAKYTSPNEFGDSRFSMVTHAINSDFDENKPEGPNNEKLVRIEAGGEYKVKILDSDKDQNVYAEFDADIRHVQGRLNTLNGDATNSIIPLPAGYNYPRGVKCHINWVMRDEAVVNSFNSDAAIGEEKITNRGNYYFIKDDEELSEGSEYEVVAPSGGLVFGVKDFSGWRYNQDQDKKYIHGEPKSIYNWPVWGANVPFTIETTKIKKGPEYWADGGSVVNTLYNTLSKKGEINFNKLALEGDGYYWKMPLQSWTPGRNKHDVYAEEYDSGRLSQTQFKQGYLYEIRYVHSDQDRRPWSYHFALVSDNDVRNRDDLVGRFHINDAFDDPNSRLKPLYSGYAKDAQGRLIKLDPDMTESAFVIMNHTNIVMAAHDQNPFSIVGLKGENDWGTKGEPTYLKITESDKYWDDGWAYWAAQGDNPNAKPNFESNHWNLPLKHISPGMIVEGDDYEIIGLPSMGNLMEYSLWWGNDGSEDGRDNRGKNQYVKDDLTISANETIRVKALGTRLYLGAFKTNRINETNWSPDAEGAPIKIKRIKGPTPPNGPGYFGTRLYESNLNWTFRDPHWEKIWDWNSWLSFKGQEYKNALTRFKRGGTYRIKLRETDYSKLPAPGDKIHNMAHYEVLAAVDKDALRAGPQNSMNFMLLGTIRRSTPYLDIKKLAYPNIVFSTVEGPDGRSLEDWGVEGEEVRVDTTDYGTDYESGPVYYGASLTSTKPDFVNEHYLTPLNSVKLTRDQGYRIRRTDYHANGAQELGTYSMWYVLNDDDLDKRHNENSRFKEYKLTLPPKPSATQDAEWVYFIAEGRNLLFGCHGKRGFSNTDQWSIDGIPAEIEFEKVDPPNTEGPIYWANYPMGNKLHEKVDWTSKHWQTPVNVVKYVTIKKADGTQQTNTAFEAGKVYDISSLTALNFDLIFYEANTLYAEYPSDNSKYVEVFRLKRGIVDTVRYTPRKSELFVGAHNISSTDYRSADHRFWSRKGEPLNLEFKEIEYPEGPGYWADHGTSHTNWHNSDQNVGGNPRYTVKCPELDNTFWYNPINTVDGIAAGANYEVAPKRTDGTLESHKYTYTIWEADGNQALNPRNTAPRHWRQLGETLKKGTKNTTLITTGTRYIIVGCQETGVALIDDAWSPRGMPVDINLEFKRIKPDRGPSFFADKGTGNTRYKTDWGNRHWIELPYTSHPGGFLAGMEYKVKISNSPKNSKYKHSVWMGYDCMKDTGSDEESCYRTYQGELAKKGSPYHTGAAKIKLTGTYGRYIQMASHKFGTDNRRLTNWSKQGEACEIYTRNLGLNTDIDYPGLWWQILQALGTIATALAVLMMWFKKVPPEQWLMTLNMAGPNNQVWTSNNTLDSKDKNYTGVWYWRDKDDKLVSKNTYQDSNFFFSACPKWMNLYADPEAATMARFLGLQHNGYWFDISNYYNIKDPKRVGIGFCNLTPTFAAGFYRLNNPNAVKVSFTGAVQINHINSYHFSTPGVDGYIEPNLDNPPFDKSDHFAVEKYNELQRKGEINADSYAVTSKPINENSRRPTLEGTIDANLLPRKDIEYLNRYRDEKVFNPYLGYVGAGNDGPLRVDVKFASTRICNTFKSMKYQYRLVEKSQMWFEPAMVRSVDSWPSEASYILFTESGSSQYKKTESGQIKYFTGKSASNRNKDLGKYASTTDREAWNASVCATDNDNYESFNVEDWPLEDDRGKRYFMHNIFTDTGFSTFQQCNYQNSNNSHTHHYMMMIEDSGGWPLERVETTQDVVDADYFYPGLTLDLETYIHNHKSVRDEDPHQLVYMKLQFEDITTRRYTVDLMPELDDNYAFRISTSKSGAAVNNKPRQLLDTLGPRTRLNLWGDKQVYYADKLRAIFWAVHIEKIGGTTNRYWNTTFANLKPQASLYKKTNLYKSLKDLEEYNAKKEELENQENP